MVIPKIYRSVTTSGVLNNNSSMDNELKQHIIYLAEKYETADFLPADPSHFMHMVEGEANQEAMAFLASCLSYGSRKQFFPKIQFMLDAAKGETDHWVRSGDWQQDIPDSADCYYRLYTCRDMRMLLTAYQTMLTEHGSMKEYIKQNSNHTGIGAVEALCQWFAIHGASKTVPHNTSSACKRLCMFLRWMVRSASPVDLGLWADIIDRSSLIMPLDTHVVQEALRMNIINSRTASMATAKKLTGVMLEVFPDDPLKGDFALFGLGVDEG